MHPTPSCVVRCVLGSAVVGSLPDGPPCAAGWVAAARAVSAFGSWGLSVSRPAEPRGARPAVVSAHVFGARSRCCRAGGSVCCGPGGVPL
eukprot:8912296-Alexandrium_andersonii.AAC.1